MKLGSEYLTSNRFTAFPFSDSAPGVVYSGAAVTTGAGATIPPNFLVDAMIIVPAGTGTVYLDHISVGDGLLLHLYADGNELITVPHPSFPPTPSRDVYYLLSASNAAAVVRLLVTTECFDYLSSVTGTASFGLRLPFSPAVVEARPLRVQTFELVNLFPTEPLPDAPGSITGDVQLLRGHNIQLELNNESPGLPEITLSAIPGAGAGTVPCLDGSLGVGDPIPAELLPKRVGSGLRPDADGNLALDGDACFNFTPSADGMTIQTVCKRCCDCDDYVAVGEDIRTLLTRTRDAYDHLHTIHIDGVDGYDPTWNSYETAVAHWNAIAGPRPGNRLEVTGVGLRGYSGADKYYTVTVFIRNLYLNSIAYTLTLASSATLEKGWRVENGVIYSALFPSVSGASSANISTRYQWELFEDTPPSTIAATLTYTVGVDPTVHTHNFTVTIV